MISKITPTLIIAIVFMLLASYAHSSGWQQLNSGTNEELRSVAFSRVFPNKGIVGGSNKSYFKTNDNGENWTLNLYVYESNFQAAQYVSDELVVMAGTKGLLIRSNNGGVAWQRYNPVELNTTINDFHFSSASYGILVTDRGDIKRTSIGGTSWFTNESPRYVRSLNSVHCLNDDIAWLVGDNGLIAKSEDQGRNWTNQTEGNSLYHLLDVYFIDDTTGFAVGSEGTILKTIDAGVNWFEIITGFDEDLYSVEFNTTGEIGFIVGANGLIIASNDRGNTWVEQASSTLENLYDIHFVSPDIGYIVGNNGVILKTINAGVTFPRRLAVIEPKANDVWTKGETRTIAWERENIEKVRIDISYDRGLNWEVIDTVISSNSYQFTVPDSNSTQCLIRVMDFNDPDYFSVSSGLFTITNVVITVNSPNGGEKWSAGTNRQIRWTASNVDSVSISYSIDNANSWTTINNKVGAIPGELVWSVPKKPSDSAFIKVASYINQNVHDISDNPFTIAGLELTSFNSGNRFLYGTTQTITWNSVDVDSVRIQYSTDDGANWITIEESYPAVSGIYNWQIPATPTDEALVRVTDQFNSLFSDISDVTFTISGIVLTSPVGGEIWIAGTVQPITWQSEDIQRIKLEYTYDDALSWVTINSDLIASSGQFFWEIPKTPTNRTKVRITALDNPTVSDISEEFFTISGNGVLVTFPNGGEIFELDSTYKITWAESNVARLNIEYSVDNGNSWRMIYESINADNREFDWRVPDSLLGTTQALIRLTDADNPSIFDISDRNFKIKGAFFNVPQKWDFSSQTDNSAVIILPASVNPKIGDVALRNYDAVGVFYEVNGQRKCAGYSLWDGSNMSITVWSDNSETPTKDGFNLNEEYYFIVWDAQLGEETPATVSFTATDAEFFAPDKISIIDTFITHTSLVIPLKANVWSIISSNLIPNDVSIEVIMSEIAEKIRIMKNEDGESYLPSEGINQIANWNMTHGYQIFMNEESELVVDGIPANPGSYGKFLQSSNWYIVSYLPQNSLSTSAALVSLGNNLLMLKDEMGNIYFPDYSIDDIVMMHPGKGYKIITKSSDSLIYPGSIPSVEKSETNKNDKIQSNNFYKSDFSATGSSAVIVIESEFINEGDEFAVMVGDLIIGSDVAEAGKSVITVWGDNEFTAEKEGALINEAISIKYYNSVQSLEYDLKINSAESLISGIEVELPIKYQQDAIIKVYGEKETINSISDDFVENGINIFPNPATEQITLSSGNKYAPNIKIFDVNGNLVIEINDYRFGNQIDLQNLSSGNYIIKLNISGNELIGKFTISK